MSKLVRLLVAAAALSVAVAACGSSNSAKLPSLWEQVKSRGELKVCVADAEPYTFKNDTGQWQGIWVDYLTGWAKTLNVKLTTVDSEFSTMIAAVQSGTCDLGAALNETSARALAAVFTIPFNNVHLNFAIQPDRTSAKTFEQLNDGKYTVCVAQGSAMDTSVTGLIPAPKFQIQRLPDNSSCRLGLTSNKVDAFADDYISNAGFAKANQPAIKLIIPQVAIMKQAGGTAMPFGYRYEDLLALNVYTQNFIDSGEQASVQAKWGLDDENEYAVQP